MLCVSNDVTFTEFQTINSYFSPKAPVRVAGRTWTDVSCNEGNTLRCRRTIKRVLINLSSENMKGPVWEV